MKKTILTTAAALAMIFSVNVASAQVFEESAGNDPQQQTQQKDDYQQIETSQLPNAVQQAVEQEYQGSQISEAYLKQKDGETKYKLVLTTQDGQSQEVWSDAEGNLKDKDDK